MMGRVHKKAEVIKPRSSKVRMLVIRKDAKGVAEPGGRELRSIPLATKCRRRGTNSKGRLCDKGERKMGGVGNMSYTMDKLREDLGQGLQIGGGRQLVPKTRLGAAMAPGN